MKGLLGTFSNRLVPGRTPNEDERSISARALLGLVEVAAQLGYRKELVLEGLPWAIEDLGGFGVRISWVDLVTAIDNLERAGATGADFEDMGRRLAHTPHLVVQQIGGFFLRPHDLLFIGLRVVGPMLFPPIEAELEFGDTRARLVLSVPATFRPCAAYFHVCRGTIAAVPTVIDYPPLVVDGEIGPHRGVFDMGLPKVERGLTSLRRILGAVMSAPRAIRALALHQEELRASFEDLVKAERRFRDIIDALPDGVIIHREGQIAYVNPVLPSLLGYEGAAELVGMPWLGLVHPDDRPGALPGRELRFQRTDGASVVVELSDEQPVELHGRPARMLVARDVTARRELARHLALSDRMASLGTMAAGIAHEINNPLTLVMTNLELIGRMTNDPRVRELESGASEGAVRVRDIVRDLQLFAQPDREDEPVCELVDVGEVVRSTIALARGRLGERAILSLDIDEVAPVMASRGRLGQVVLNLVLNAIDALPDPADRAPSENRIDVRVAHDATGVIVTVTDNGTGIPLAARARIFEPFYTTKHGGGSGLGLAVARNIVEGYGGTLSFTTEIGRGAAFSVVLPPSDVAAQAPAPARPTETTARRRVLVVDDEEAVRRSISLALGERHDVTLSSSGNDAIRRLAAAAFDAILCDIMMPDGTGADVHAWMTRERPELSGCLVFMTGGTYRPETRDFVARIDNRCLDKPFRLDELFAVIDDAIACRKR